MASLLMGMRPQTSREVVEKSRRRFGVLSMGLFKSDTTEQLFNSNNRED